MTTDQLKSPSRGTWLVFLIGIAAIVAGSVGPPAHMAVGLLVLGCFAVAVSEIVEWIWRLVRPQTRDAAGPPSA